MACTCGGKMGKVQHRDGDREAQPEMWEAYQEKGTMRVKD